MLQSTNLNIYFLLSNFRLERIWRGLKDRPDLFVKYLSVFKKGTYKKVIKESVTPDLVTSLLVAVKDHSESTAFQLSALEGLTSVQNFSLMASLLPEADIQKVREILSVAEARLKASEESKKEESLQRVAELRKAFRL